MKNNLSFWSHWTDSHRHPKFLILNSHYGNGDKGHAMCYKFWILNNLIAESENCILDLTTKRNRIYVIATLDLPNEEALTEFIEFLLSDSCGLLIELGGGVTTKKVQECLARTQKDRQSARERKLRGKFHSSGEHLQGSGEPRESSEGKSRNYSKENYSKENNNNNAAVEISDHSLYVGEFKKFEEHAQNCLKDTVHFTPHVYREMQAANRIYNPDDLHKHLTEFNRLLAATEEPNKSSTDYRRHFINWMRKHLPAIGEKPKPNINPNGFIKQI